MTHSLVELGEGSAVESVLEMFWKRKRREGKRSAPALDPSKLDSSSPRVKAYWRMALDKRRKRESDFSTLRGREVKYNESSLVSISSARGARGAARTMEARPKTETAEKSIVSVCEGGGVVER